jgi:hypothetical protein
MTIVIDLHFGPFDGQRSILPVVTESAPLVMACKGVGRRWHVYRSIGKDFGGAMHYRFAKTVLANTEQEIRL